jgi:hypothetical protein
MRLAPRLAPDAQTKIEKGFGVTSETLSDLLKHSWATLGLNQ